MSNDRNSGDSGCAVILLALILLTMWGFFSPSKKPTTQPAVVKEGPK